jgi:hypothetical protein
MSHVAAQLHVSVSELSEYPLHVAVQLHGSYDMYLTATKLRATLCLQVGHAIRRVAV